VRRCRQLARGCSNGALSRRYRRRRGARESGGKLNDFSPVRRVRDLHKGAHQRKAIDDVRVHLTLSAHAPSYTAWEAAETPPIETHIVASTADPGGLGEAATAAVAPAVAMDLFVVPTIGFDLLYAFVIVRLGRRELVWTNVTANPTAEWVARQITEAFPWDEAPQHLIRDRDRIYGTMVTRRLRAMGIRDQPTAPASPWQNGFAERLIGSIRRECVDHIIVLGEMHLRRILKSYADYYNGVRTHRSLNKDAPVPRSVQRAGVISSRAVLGGLHHHYARV
jgi:transposase InsO family protein